VPTINSLIQSYLDFVNNYLTIEKFAEHHQITPKQANLILATGKELHENRVSGEE